MNFLNNRTNIWIWRQAFASLQHGFLRSEENIHLHKIYSVSEKIRPLCHIYIWDMSMNIVYMHEDLV